MISIKIKGTKYFPANEITEKLGITRQSLWRWRREGFIPPGYRYRDSQVLFTADEVESINQFANRIKRIEPRRKVLKPMSRPDIKKRRTPTLKRFKKSPSK